MSCLSSTDPATPPVIDFDNDSLMQGSMTLFSLEMLNGLNYGLKIC